VRGTIRPFWQGLSIVAVAFALIVGCWNAPFTTYDDSMHVFANEHLSDSITQILTPRSVSTYFPVTELSYSLDRALFANTLPPIFGSWAPGVRFMTLLYHIAAALLLWRFLLLLGASDKAAWFIALAFSAHPLACETVCWISERKNALAALFGFAALWAYLRFERNAWRIPATLALYALALLSKPSALGLLPVFVLIELFNGLKPQAQSPKPKAQSLLFSALRILPLAVLSWITIQVNLAGHAVTIVPPPGGSLYTALLTDLEILWRYCVNILAPFNLSAAYCIVPITSLTDPRAIKYGLLLSALIATTTYFARSRRVALFGWLWFFGALGPSLNLIAIPHAMQDRYVYLSLPGLLLVLVEFVAGLQSKIAVAVLPSPSRGGAGGGVCAESATVQSAIRNPQSAMTFLLPACFLAMLIGLSIVRSGVWAGTYQIFKDAVDKEPHSIFAHYGLGNAYSQVWQVLDKKSETAQANEYRRKQVREWQRGIDDCPDIYRFVIYQEMALAVGNDFHYRGDDTKAEHYWRIAAYRSPEAMDNSDARGDAVRSLAELRLTQHRPAEAFERIREALSLHPDEAARVVRARIVAALLKAGSLTGDFAARLKAESLADLQSVPQSSPRYKQAQETIERLSATPP
jgi:hypothetical protein